MAKDMLLLGPAVLGDPRAVLREPCSTGTRRTCRSVPSHQGTLQSGLKEWMILRTQSWDGDGTRSKHCQVWLLPLAQDTGLWVEAVTPAKLDRLKPRYSHITLQMLG